MQRFNATRQRLAELLVREDDYWRQRAKSFWLQDGDLNTKYFHSHATSHRKAKRINSLMDTDGVLHETHEGICMVAKSYFEDLFAASEGVFELVLGVVDQRVTLEDNEMVLLPFTKEEFRVTLF